MYPLDKLCFDLSETLCLQDSIAEPFSRFCNGTIEHPIQVMDGGVVDFRCEKKNKSCDCDPGPGWQRNFLTDPFANVIDALVQEENRKTDQEAKKGHATQRNADFHDVRLAYSLAHKKTKHAIDEIEQSPQLFRRGMAGPQEVEKCRSCAGIGENKCWQSNQATP